jgi:hypothetical protein
MRFPFHGSEYDDRAVRTIGVVTDPDLAIGQGHNLNTHQPCQPDKPPVMSSPADPEPIVPRLTTSGIHTGPRSTPWSWSPAGASATSSSTNCGTSPACRAAGPGSGRELRGGRTRTSRCGTCVPPGHSARAGRPLMAARTYPRCGSRSPLWAATRPACQGPAWRVGQEGKDKPSATGAPPPVPGGLRREGGSHADRDADQYQEHSAHDVRLTRTGRTHPSAHRPQTHPTHRA